MAKKVHASKGKKKPNHSAKIKELYGDDWYVRMGRMGGKASGNRGFASSNKGSDGLTGKQRARKNGYKSCLKRWHPEEYERRYGKD